MAKQINPKESHEAMQSEALLLDRQGHVAEAIAAYERLLGSWPALPDCWYNLAVLQRRRRQFSAALSSYQQALDRGVKKPEEVHLNRGVIYSDYLRQDDAAERELKAALSHNPNYAPALFNLANLHEDYGRRQMAARVYQRLLALDPQSARVLARYAGLMAYADLSDPLIERLRQALARTDITVADRASLEFALGRALDECQAYSEAFEMYSAANAHSRQSAPPGTVGYDRGLAKAYTERLIAAFPAAAAASATATATANVTAKALPRPIFVCGMYRSGSTLTEQLLAGHPQVAAGGELDFLPNAVQTDLAPFPESVAVVLPQRLKTLAAEYRQTLGDMFPGAAYVTDKRPENYLNIGLIKRLFPDAKIVHTTRNALDNCLSIYFLHLDQRMSYALNLMDIGHHYQQYLRLMRHWKALYGADILDIDYDALVREPKLKVQELLSFLGLDWDERCLTVSPGRAVKTASVWQVREPLYQRSSGRARHYEKELAELRNYLESGES
ncbi:MAG TPA: sulfotransferase [Steroidobacteraceae bacterium]|jgi:tetratricopeptide (TPR) repeat protein|nr:sulfotransferase [Steroidobacteraceae bacterium]